MLYGHTHHENRGFQAALRGEARQTFSTPRVTREYGQGFAAGLAERERLLKASVSE